MFAALTLTFAVLTSQANSVHTAAVGEFAKEIYEL